MVQEQYSTDVMVTAAKDSMQKEDITAIFRTHWRTGYGSVSPDEALYIRDLIARDRPRDFIEIGTGSGLSGGLICHFLEENGGETFVTLDHDNTFFGDNSKENGFLIEPIYPGGAVKVEKRPFTTGLDLDDMNRRFDMAFVDANHQHPWPLIDTLALWPHMRGDGPRTVIHHDLFLFRKQDIVFGIGPKYLFDQFPESHREASPAGGGNIFSLSLAMERDRLEEIAANGISLPWSLRTPLQDSHLKRIFAMIDRHYSPYLGQVFREAAAKFNHMDRFRTGL